MNRGRFVLGAIIGAAAGVVAGLLAAPKSGKETRADLKGKAAELKESASRKAGDIRHRSKQTLDKAEDRIEEIGDEALDDAKHKLGKRA